MRRTTYRRRWRAVMRRTTYRRRRPTYGLGARRIRRRATYRRWRTIRRRRTTYRLNTWRRTTYRLNRRTTYGMDARRRSKWRQFTSLLNARRLQSRAENWRSARAVFYISSFKPCEGLPTLKHTLHSKGLPAFLV